MTRLALLVLLLLAFPACKRQKTCTSELTEGGSLYHASASGTEGEAELTERATRLACARMCVMRGPAKKVACEGGCEADVAAKKLGLKSTCKAIEGR